MVPHPPRHWECKYGRRECFLQSTATNVSDIKFSFTLLDVNQGKIKGNTFKIDLKERKGKKKRNVCVCIKI